MMIGIIGFSSDLVLAAIGAFIFPWKSKARAGKKAPWWARFSFKPAAAAVPEPN